MYTGLSVFDLDHTLLKVNSSHAFGSFLYRSKYISLGNLTLSLTYYFCHKYLGLSLDSLHQKAFSLLFKGKSILDIEQLCLQFLEEKYAVFVSETVKKKLDEALHKGHYTIILSAAPDFIVAPLSKRFAVHDFQATPYAYDDEGLFSHIPHIMDGISKANYLKNIISQLKINREMVYVYTDSYLDIDLLNMAGNAIGVRPDNKLRKTCLKNGWEIIL